MKLEKILKDLNVVTLNRVLLKAHEAMNDVRRREAWIENFFKKIKKIFQEVDVSCSFSNSHEIECSCVNSSHVNRFESSRDENLIIVSSMIIFNWTKHMRHFMCDDSLLNVWMLCHDYIEKNLNVFMSKIDVNDKWLIELRDNVFNSVLYDDDVSSVVVLILKKCFNAHVKNTFQISRLARFDRKNVIIHEHMKFAWNRAIIDKTHTKQILNSDIIYIFKCLSETIRKWFFMKTSFENSFD